MRKRDIQAFFGVLTVIGIAAYVVKYMSPGHKCPECDRVIGFVNAIQSFCPTCGKFG